MMKSSDLDSIPLHPLGEDGGAVDSPRGGRSMTPDRRDSELGLEGPHYTRSTVNSAPILTATILCLFAPLSFGLSLGYTSPTLAQTTSDLDLTESQAALFAALLNIGALAGSLAGGKLGDMFGRKGGMQRAAPVLVIGWALTALAQSPMLLYAGRLLVGAGVGMNGVFAPLYIGEVATVNLRGALGSLNQLAITVGILLVYLAGMYTDWRTLAWLCGLVGGLSAVAMAFAPESPAWLVGRRDEGGAKRALYYLRGSEAAAIREYNDLMSARQSSGSSGTGGYGELFAPGLFAQTVGVLGCVVLQQWSGINVVIFYSGGIFKDAGFGDSANMAALAVAGIQVPVTLLSVFLMDRAGRVKLLQAAGVMMGGSLLLLAYFFHLLAANQAEGWGALAVFSLMAFIAGFSIGWGPVPWVLISEVFDSTVGSRAASLAISLSFVNSMLVTYLFPNMRQLFGAQSLFMLYAAVCLLGSLGFVTARLPETKGKNSEEIARAFRAIR
eukprot:comp20846_c0_seq1/m.27559 comp20846_c0_seq1/g.27559  ORF comp20846_c0_seq1/g.27559 comp20846_c0_seq1/m.27559 type:complete len:498 (-) comp20846_c0_seq1:33-1526(-)